MATITIEIELITVTCSECACVFGLSESHRDQLKKTARTFYCPNGHPQYFGPSQAELKIKNLEQRLKEEEQEREYWHKSYKAEEQEHKSTKNQLRGTKSALTETKKRIGNGVCPCCSRTFKQLSRHMRDKHPEYEVEANRE